MSILQHGVAKVLGKIQIVFKDGALCAKPNVLPVDHLGLQIPSGQGHIPAPALTVPPEGDAVIHAEGGSLEPQTVYAP